MIWRRHLGVFLVALICLPTAIGAVRSLERERPVVELGWEGVVKQSHPNFCGPAVIATMLQSLGVEASEAEIAESAKLQPGGVSLAEFSRLADQYGLPGRWFAVADETDLESLPVPGVVHLNGPAGHFAIFERVLDGFVQLADPARGRLLVAQERFERDWTGRIFLFEPRPAFRPR